MGASSSSQSSDQARNRKFCCACSNSDETIRLLDGAGDAGDQQEASWTDGENYSVIQFSCPMYFCQEIEGAAKLDVVRFGDTSTAARVEYFTVDSSAKAGIKYQQKYGVMNFKPGETSQTLEIPIINDEGWDATLEFGVSLRNCRGSQLGMYLSTCRVKIIDDDWFPTNRYARYFREGQIHEIPNLGLFWEYCKMNMQIPIVKWGTIKLLFLDQVKNLYFILCLYLQMYLVDVVLAPPKEEESGPEHEGEHEGGEIEGEERRLLLRFVKTAARAVRRVLHEEEGEAEEHGPLPEVLIIPNDRLHTAMIVGAMYILPFILVHLIDHRKLTFGITGAARRHLQANLLRKFLNYKEENRNHISGTDITMTMIRDSFEVVNFGYMKALELCRIFGSLTLAILFIASENPSALITATPMPIVLAFFLCCRGGPTIEAAEEAATTQNKVVQHANEAVSCFRLIADFYLRPYMVDIYEQKIDAYNDSNMNLMVVMNNNMYVPPWVTTVFVGVYMMTAPLQLKAFGGELTLGAFLATINIFKEIGTELAEVYHEFMEVQTACGPLKKVSHFMNMETDLVSRMKLNRMRRTHGENQRLAARREHTSQTEHSMIRTDKGEQVFAVDMIQIKITDLSFSYPGAAPVLDKLNFSFDQGRLYAFVGRAHEGKGTLLKLLGQVLLPDASESASGTIFVPPHLRILHLSTECLFLTESLLKNLIFNMDIQKLGGISRIKTVCKRIGFPSSFLNYIVEDTKADESKEMEQEGENHLKEVFQTWFAGLSHSDYARITLARALIMNPECLVLHKPAVCFDESEAPEIINLIRQHVDDRGIELPEEGKKFRRRRTCFFTSTTHYGVKAADAIFEVSSKRGLAEISVAEALQQIAS